LAEIAAKEEEGRVAEARRRASIAAEEQARAAAEARRIAAERQLEEEERRRAEKLRALAAFTAEEASKAKLSQQEIERDREAQQLGDKLKLIRESTTNRPHPYPMPYGLGAPVVGDPALDTHGASFRTRVTVLLVMQPGNRGIRRFEKTADPILCVGSWCYVSRGAAAPAERMSRGKAFGPGVALGSRAGACRHSLTCVFRNVDLERTMAEVQPIDLRILRHDRREPRAVMADPTCRLDAGRLSCLRPVIADNYMLWVVPENVAERAGSLALETAVRTGLPGSSGFALTDRR
jgi:colicin import membrane protein